MHRVFITALSTAVSCLTASSTYALTYNESVSGDLPDFGSPLPIFQLTAGNNTITGTVTHSTNFPQGDFDSFAFNIPAGLTLTSGNIIMSDVTGDLISSTWRFNKGSANWYSGTTLENITAISPGTTSFASIPATSDIYNFTHTQMYRAQTALDSISSYTITFTVVPEPSPLAMITLAGYFAFLRKRNKSR